MQAEPGHPFFDVLTKLDRFNIHYHLGRYQPESVTIHATLVGLRAEIDVHAGGDVLICCFHGDEGYTDEGLAGLDRLLDSQGREE